MYIVYKELRIIYTHARTHTGAVHFLLAAITICRLFYNYNRTLLSARAIYIDGREKLVKRMKKRNRYYRLVARANHLRKSSSDVQDSEVLVCLVRSAVHCLRHAAAAVATIAATAAEAAYV
uniref:Uncharacterized protein n=1 Tax=Trichogramma kaykai TaxID=54128 RepID=A0ABD2WU87_9HYME